MRKFLCYDTNDAASGKIGVNSNGVLSPNATVPSTNGAPYQQLVTDGDGGVKWEDRLVYDNKTVLVEQTKITNAGRESIIDLSLLANGSFVTVNIDGTEYNVTLEEGGEYMLGTGTSNCYYHIGHSGGINISSKTTFASGYPFFVVIDEDGACMVLFDGESVGTEHTFGVYAGEIKQIDPKYINDMYYTKTTPGSDGPIVTFKAYENSVSPLTLSEPVIVDAPYTVKVGNDEYKTIGTTDGDNLYIQVDTQGSLPAQGTLIVTDPINNPLVAMWQGNKTNKKIEIVRESQEEIKQIDPKYIPPTTVIVNLTANEDGTFSADKTFDEVKALIDSGFNVKCSFKHIEAPCIVYTTENTNTVIGFEIVDVSERIGYIAIFTPDTVLVNEINVDDLLLPPINNNYGFLQAINGVWEISPDIILPSATSGSSKKFKITVNDSGTITATEV